MADRNNCFVCDKSFPERKYLYTHMRKVHDVEPNTEGTVKCPEDNCSFSFNLLANLRAHVQKEHLVPVLKEEIEFQSMEDFLNWKSTEEKTARSSFVMHGGAKRVKDGTKIIYLCHRSGIFTSQSKGERMLKSQGSNKIGGHCTASVELTRRESGVCTVVYFKTHFGHEMNIGFLRLSKLEKQVIAGKIAEGVSFQRILDDVRDDVHSEEIQRLHLLSRKDLHNIKTRFQVDVHQFHSNDEISVRIFLDKIKESVLLHKKVGDHVENLGSDDTVIVLMTDLQSELLQKFGSDIICVDSTHCTNVYKLLLTTLLVIDEFGSGLPVAFCVSNKENTEVMVHFFMAVRQKVGIIQPTVFMSDDTNVFRCAWTHVMGLPKHNLLCAWHVDKSWRNNLKKVRGGLYKQAEVYKALRMLLEEADQEKFGELLELFEKELQDDGDTKAFGKYFTNNYGFRAQNWAYCHRRNLNINTNMHLEAFHRVLKYCYLDGKTNNRLDKLLLILMKFTRDKLFERLGKLCKGGHSHRTRQIQERHKKSKTIAEDQITADGDGKQFYVQSQTVSGVTYKVTLKSVECNVSCRLLCNICGICIHSFSCCCPDNLINLNICIHIHAVAMKYAINSSKTSKQIETASIEEASAILSAMKKQNDRVESDSLGTELKAKITALLSQVDSMDTETKGTMVKEVDRLLSLADSGHKREGPRCASNEKVKVQRIPDKRKIRPKSILAKPTVAEKANVADTLKQPDSQVLAVHVGFDHTYAKN